MSSKRVRPLLVLLALALGATGTATTLIHPTNPNNVPNGLDASADAESTAIYCTGLSGASGGLEGHVALLNTSGAVRTLSIQVVSNTGQRRTTTMRLGARATSNVVPDFKLKGSSYAVAVVVDGGGVVAEEITQNATGEVPCSTSGVTQWYGSGFDTLVGSRAALSLYNPTATPAVLNATFYTSSGIAAPASFQGFSVAAHSQAELNLGSQIVNASNVGVAISVVRGSLDVVGVQKSGDVVSLDPGSTVAAGESWFPRVTTVGHSVVQLRIANPNSQPATVTLTIDLSPFRVAPQTVTVPAYSSSDVAITPNSAIPEAGYASVHVNSSAPVISSLATGTSAGLRLSPAGSPTDRYLVADFAGTGFNSATITNTLSRTVGVTFTTVASSGTPSVTVTGTLAGDTTRPIAGFFHPVISLRATAILVSATKPNVLVTLTLPSRPRGVVVVAPLNGG